jgi:hypothetical protein
MLQIKKITTLTACKYNVQFLFRHKNSPISQVIKTAGHSVFLRSPKHFNIGKQKIFNLNYKSPLFVKNFNVKFFLTNLFRLETILYKIFLKQIKVTPVVKMKSIKFTVKAKYKIMWLGI